MWFWWNVAGLAGEYLNQEKPKSEQAARSRQSSRTTKRAIVPVFLPSVDSENFPCLSQPSSLDHVGGFPGRR